MFALYSERCPKPGEVLSKEMFFILHLPCFGVWATTVSGFKVRDRIRTGKAKALTLAGTELVPMPMMSN